MAYQYLGNHREGHRSVESAIQTVTGTKMKSMSAGKMGFSTTQVGDLVVKALTTS